MRSAGVIVADAGDRAGRLEGWKMIAAFVGRDERTAKRWEVTRGLPVRRLPGENRSMVFAYAQELVAWRDSIGVAEPLVEDVPPPAPLVEAAMPEPVDAPPPPESIATALPARRRWWRIGAVSALVAALLAAAVLLVWRSPAETGGTRDQVAAAFYRQGKLDWSLRTPASLKMALDRFHAAVRRDPDYAQAYVGLAQTYELMREFGGMADTEAYPKAEAAARQALSLAPDLAEAHAALAFVLFWWEWDRGAAEREFRAAIRLDPEQATPHHWFATALQAEERLPEALTEIRRAQDLDPACAACAADEAGMLVTGGHPREAAVMLRHLAAADPTLCSPHALLGDIAWHEGDVAGWLAESEIARRLRGDVAGVAAIAADRAAWQHGGQPALVAEMVRRQRQSLGDGAATSYAMARTLAMAGEADGALTVLEGALRNHDAALMGLAIDPALVTLHGLPRFTALVAATRAAP